MGVQITELLVKKEIEISSLRGKLLAVDAPNHLYQFLATIRQPDGRLFTDAQGNVTSHLIGLLSRTANLLRQGVQLVYVFDGQVPELKRAEITKRAQAKQEAAKKFEEAQKIMDVDGMKKYAARTSRLTQDMIEESKKLLDALGVPCVQAPSEAEAQAAYMARKGDCYAVASQDADALLFGAPLVVRNLSITGKRKMAGRLNYLRSPPELISLAENLQNMGIAQEQLIALAMLVGTDYNNRGIRGVGPKNALKLVKEYREPERIFSHAKWDEHFTVSWQEVYDLIRNMKISDEYTVIQRKPDREKVLKLLCEGHGFSADRVEKTLAELMQSESKAKQKGLMDFA